MLKLGYTVDAGPGWAPVDLTTAGATGKRVMLRNAQSCIFLVDLAAAASGTEDVVFTLNEHNASTSGTTQAPTIMPTVLWIKSATALAGTESWVKQTTGFSTNTVTIAGATYAAKQVKAALQVNTKDLDDGFDYVSLSVGDPGSVSRLGSCSVLLTDLTVRRDPANLKPTLF